MGGILEALRHVAPLAAGFMERYQDGDETNGEVTPFATPPDYIATMMLSRSRDGERVLSHVSSVLPGTVLQDRAVLSRDAWREIEGYVALERFGLFHPLALKLASPAATEPGWQTYLALYGDDPRRPLRPEECHNLTILQPDILRALRRIRLPLASEEPLFAQIAREQRLGMICFTRSGMLTAANGRAWALAERFAKATQGSRRDRLHDFAGWLAERGGAAEWVVHYADPAGAPVAVIASRHVLSGHTHACAEDLLLFLLREVSVHLPPGRPPERPWLALPHRLSQIAELLVSSGRPYKQLADEVGISLGTFRKHVERLYRALGVQSRAELTANASTAAVASSRAKRSR